MDLKDLFLTPFYLVIIYLFAYYIKKNQTDKYIAKYFIPALSVKIFGSFIFALIYQFYYAGGDTFVFFLDAKKIGGVFLENPFIALKILFLDSNEYTADTLKYTSSIIFFHSPNEWLLVKITTFVGLFTFYAYLSTSFIFASFAFLGTWKLYLFFYKFYPNLYKQLAVCILFVPSCIFWASGILKDTIALGAICFITYYGAQAIYFKIKILKSLIICFILFNILIGIKFYILTSFLPGAILWIFLRYKSKITFTPFRILINGSVILLIPVMLFYLITGIAQQIENSAEFKNAQNIVKGFQGDHGSRTVGHGGGEASSYVLSKIDYSLIEMITSIPETLNVTLFRPYLWEVKKPIVLITALESTCFLLVTIYLIIKAGIFKSFKIIISSPEVILCFSFTIILGFIVGLTSYNFGVLARFKAPLMPYYGTGLFIIYEISKRKKKRKVKTHKSNVSSS